MLRVTRRPRGTKTLDTAGYPRQSQLPPTTSRLRRTLVERPAGTTEAAPQAPCRSRHRTGSNPAGIRSDFGGCGKRRAGQRARSAARPSATSVLRSSSPRPAARNRRHGDRGHVGEDHAQRQGAWPCRQRCGLGQRRQDHRLHRAEGDAEQRRAIIMPAARAARRRPATRRWPASSQPATYGRSSRCRPGRRWPAAPAWRPPRTIRARGR